MRMDVAFSREAVLASPVVAIAEPYMTALLLAAFGLLALCSVLFSRTIDRLGIPIVLLFIVLGMIGGSEGLVRIPFDDHGLAVRLGTIALVLILFDGGLNTLVSSIRRVIWPSSVLATAGVSLTAAMLALTARALGLGWTESLVLGAVVSSTDAAAVFAVLRGGRLQLRQHVGRTIEVESCINDPMAVILTLSLIEVFTAGDVSWPTIVLAVPVQLAVGTAIGAGFGWLGRLLLIRVRVPTSGLYPVLTLALAFLSFGVATVSWGSGFLAVFVTGVVLGSANVPYRNGLARVHDAIAWLSQVSMFLMMGLLVFPSQLVPMAWQGLLLALALAIVIRPLAVWLCLLPFRFPGREVALVGWVGLRGAVPIILATFPVLAQVPGAMDVFNLVFFIVVVSTLIPGATIRAASRRLGLTIPERPQPSAVLEINSTYSLNGELASFLIDPSVAVCGALLSEVEFPRGAAAVLIVRGRELIAPRGQTQIQAGDHVYVFFQPSDRPTIELLFGGPEAG